jgi:hypothetical protein
MRRSIAFISMVAVFGAGLAAGCSRAGPSASPDSSHGQGAAWHAYESAANDVARRGKVIYQVTYQPDAVVFDQPSTEHALRNISADGATYTLDAAVPAATQLRAGSVLFLHGIAIRKVTAVHREGSIVTATTADADITDAIRDGHIEWQLPIDYSVAGFPENAAQSHRFEDLVVTPVLAAGPTMSFGGSADKFKCELGFGYAASRLNLDIHASYTGPEANIELQGKGYVQNLVATGSIDVSGGLIDKLKAGAAAMQGHIDFDWSGILKSSGDRTVNRQFKVKIPGASVQYPMIVGGIPFVLEFSAAVMVQPAFSSKNAITTGHFTVDYSGSEGLTTAASPPQPQGDMTGTGAVGHDTSVKSVGAMGFVAALEMPRFEVSLAILTPPGLTELGDKLAYNAAAGFFNRSGDLIYRHNIAKLIKELALPVKPYAYDNVVTSTGTFTNGGLTSGLVALPPCQRAQMTVTANAGVGVKLNFRNLPAVVSALQQTTGPKLEFAVSSPSWKYSFTGWKDHIKCPGD